MYLDEDFTKFQKTKLTKSYSDFKKKYKNHKRNGAPAVFDFFQKNIDNVSLDVFKKRANILYYLLEDAHNDRMMSKKIKAEFVSKIKKKLSSKENVSINMEKFFADINNEIDYIVENIDRENSLAFFATPIINESYLSNSLDLKYRDIKIEILDNFNLLVCYEDDKKSRIIKINSKISTSYMLVFEALIKKYGVNSKIFPESEQKSWTITKVGKILYKSFLPYMEGDIESIKENTFLTTLKQALKNRKNIL